MVNFIKFFCKVYLIPCLLKVKFNHFVIVYILIILLGFSSTALLLFFLNSLYIFAKNFPELIFLIAASSDQFLKMLTSCDLTGGPAVQTSTVPTHSVPAPASCRSRQQIHASEARRESGTDQKPARNRAALERGGRRPGRRHHGLLLHLCGAGAQWRKLLQMENHGRDQSHAFANGLQGGGGTIRKQNAVLPHHREGRVRPLWTLQRRPHRVGRRNVNDTCLFFNCSF